jgi:hypothetical protein
MPNDFEPQSNGLWRGRTDATLESIAKSIDEIKGQIGLNCPVGKDNRERIHELEMNKGKWLDTLVAIIATAVITATVAKLI